MVECYYVILIIVLMYFIYVNCNEEDRDNDSDDSVEEGFRSISKKSVFKKPIFYKKPIVNIRKSVYTKPIFGVVSRVDDRKTLGRGLGRVGSVINDYTCPAGYPTAGALGCYNNFFGPRKPYIEKQKPHVPYSLSGGNAIPDPTNGKGKWEKCGLLYYPKCPPGYNNVGCNICKPQYRAKVDKVIAIPSNEKRAVAVYEADYVAAVAADGATYSIGNLNEEEKKYFEQLLVKLENRTMKPSEGLDFVELLNKRNGRNPNVCNGDNEFMPSKHCFSINCKGRECATYEKENIKLNIPKRNKLRECITGDEEECFKLPCYGDLSKCIEKNNKIDKIDFGSRKKKDNTLYLHKLLNEYRREKNFKKAKLIVNLPGWRNKRKKDGLKWARKKMIPYEEYP